MSTYTQIYIHAVFAVKNRARLIDETWRKNLYKYITGIIQNHGHKLLTINGSDDHVHILFGQNPMQSVSDLMRDVKRDSSKWVNENKFVRSAFGWQNGYGAFSYSHSQIEKVAEYIRNQEAHHAEVSVLDEYKKMLDNLGITCKDEYLFN